MNEFMKSVFEVIDHWNGLGSWFFFVIILGMVFAGVMMPIRYVVILFRGWPPVCSNCEDAAKKEAARTQR